MTKISVTEFAEQRKIKPEELIEMLRSAGVEVKGVEHMISDEEKRQLLLHLHQGH